MPATARTSRLRGWAAALCAAACLGPTSTPALAETTLPKLPAFVRMITQGSGPTESVTRFEVIPGAPLPARRSLTALAAEQSAGAASAASLALLNTGLAEFGDEFGAASAGGTFVEHALGVNGLGNINTFFTWFGLATTVISAANDFSQDKPTDVAAGMLKGLMGFAISNWGSSAVQVGGVSLYFVDLTLRKWGEATVDAGLNNFRDVYRASFEDDPRSVNDWKRIVWETYLKAEQWQDTKKDPAANVFATLLTAEIRRYTSREFTPEMLLNWDKSTAGLGMLGDQKRIEEKLAQEYQTEIEAMLLTDVYPELARKAGARSVAQLVSKLNANLRPDLNKSVTLEVLAWGLTGPAQVEIPVAAGPPWGGATDASGAFHMTFTRLAFLKAGFPAKVILHHDGVAESRDVRIVADKMVAVFGEPQARIISRFRLKDGPRSCVVTLRDAQTGALIDVKSLDFPALPDSQLDLASLPSGTLIAGAYDPAKGTWSTASPGQWHLGTEIMFAPPFYADIDKISDCGFDFLTPAGKMNIAQCRFWRRTEKLQSGKAFALRCDSPGKIELMGVFADAATLGLGAGGMTYYPLDGPAGKALVETLRGALSKGAQGFDLGSLKGITP